MRNMGNRNPTEWQRFTALNKAEIWSFGQYIIIVIIIYSNLLRAQFITNFLKS